jgi:hypothetical protein
VSTRQKNQKEIEEGDPKDETVTESFKEFHIF